MTIKHEVEWELCSSQRARSLLIVRDLTADVGEGYVCFREPNGRAALLCLAHGWFINIAKRAPIVTLVQRSIDYCSCTDEASRPTIGGGRVKTREPGVA